MTANRISLPPMRGLSLERMLPLLLVVLLLLVIGAEFGITSREVMYSSQVAAAARLTSAAHELAATAGESVQQRAKALRGVGSDSLIRAALAGAVTMPAALDTALKRVLPAADTGITIQLWNAAGRSLDPIRFGSIESASPGAVVPPRDDSTRLGSFFVFGGHIFYWIVTPVIYRGRRIGWVGEQRRLIGSVRAEEELRGLIGEGASIYLRNDTGSVWVTLTGSVARPPTDPRIEGHIETWRRGDRPASHRLLVAESPIDGTPWTIALEQPLQVATASSRASLVRLAGFNIALLLVGGVVAWGIGRWLTRPLVELTEATALMASGDYAQVVVGPAERGGEVGRLAESFNRMAAEVSASHDELEQQVEEAQALSEELEQANAQLSDTTRDAEEARAAAESANRAKSEFLAMMSHEFRTPLNAIAGYVELLEMGVRGPVTPQQREDLARIRRSQRTLLALVDDVLSFARIEAARVEYHLAAVPLDEALIEAEALIAPQAQMKGIVYEFRPAGGGVEVWADREKLERIVLNLLSNAVKFTEPGGRVTLTGERHGDDVLVRVIDTGRGIAPDQLESIFEPFKQAETGLTRTTEGTGLGLAISREFARAMGGDVTVESVEARGSTFTLRLPARAGAAPAGPGPIAGLPAMPEAIRNQ